MHQALHVENMKESSKENKLFVIYIIYVLDYGILITYFDQSDLILDNNTAILPRQTI